MKARNWLDEIYEKVTPAKKAVYERRAAIQELKNKQHAGNAELVRLEIQEKGAHVAVTDDPTMENIAAWNAEREKVRVWSEGIKLMAQMGTHYSDSLEGHGTGAEEILLPAFVEVAAQVKEKIDQVSAEENKRLASQGLDPVESPALEPLKKYYEELNDAIISIQNWSDGNVQSAWRKYNHLIKNPTPKA